MLNQGPAWKERQQQKHAFAIACSERREKSMNKRVLVVDDDQTIRALLQELLEDEAYEVDTAQDGFMAWEKLTRQPGTYEAILLDMHLPGLDGLHLLQALQEQQEALLRAVIVLSSDSDAMRQAFAIGVCHGLQKPFDLEAVLSLVDTCQAL